MNNLSSYCGLIDGKIRASDQDLPVPTSYGHYDYLPAVHFGHGVLLKQAIPMSSIWFLTQKFVNQFIF